MEWKFVQILGSYYPVTETNIYQSQFFYSHICNVQCNPLLTRKDSHPFVFIMFYVNVHWKKAFSFRWLIFPIKRCLVSSAQPSVDGGRLGGQRSDFILCVKIDPLGRQRQSVKISSFISKLSNFVYFALVIYLTLAIKAVSISLAGC